MQNSEAKLLISRYREGKATEEEVDQLLNWVQNFESADAAEFSVAELDSVSAEMWRNLSSYPNKKTRSLWPRIAAAASVVLCIGAGAYLLFKRHTPVRLAQSQIHDLTPGTGKAVLKIGGGKTFVLDSTNNGLIAREGNTAINKSNTGQIAYSAGTGVTDKLIYDTLQVPAGAKICRLKLSDGSQLVLNTATTLIFPERFIGNERKVELVNGEVYFEVVHDPKMPFRVINHHIVTEDLGTHFNISAYDGEPMVTTLLKGSVKVATISKSIILKPGQQSLINSKSLDIMVKDADTEEAVAWKEGLFIFNGENLAGIMRQVSRWYNVEVIFKDPGLQDKLFSGSVSRFSNASMVLSKLALTGSVHFKITGRRIEVTK
jgi:transmembrane sensor